MVRLLWLLTLATTATLVAGIRLGWLDPTGNWYLALLVASALLLGLSLGFAAALLAATLHRIPTWSALLVCIAVCGAAASALLWAAMAALPPVYIMSDVSSWVRLPAWRIMAYFLAPAALLAGVPSFGVWRWWLK